MWRLYGRRVLLSMVGVLVIAGLWAREEIVYNVRLFDAYQRGQAYYEDNPYIAKNVPYGQLPHQVLDVYQPETPGSYPVVVYIHGGGWNSGNKELYALVAQKLVPFGVVVVVPRYQLYPDATYDQMQADVSSALAWTVNSIAQYNGDPQRILYGGQSAGAQLSAMTVFDRSVLAAYNLTPQAICAYYGISGVYDIRAQYDFEVSNGRTAPVMTAVMGGESSFAATSPINFAHADVPRVLLIHGDQDETVPLQMSRDFFEALQAVNASASLAVYPGRGHSELLFYTLTQNPGELITDIIALAKSC